jgi:hypothetical protein
VIVFKPAIFKNTPSLDTAIWTFVAGDEFSNITAVIGEKRKARPSGKGYLDSLPNCSNASPAD